MRNKTALIGLVLAGLVLVLGGAAPANVPHRSPLEEPEPTRLVRLFVPGRAALDRIADAGFDLTHEVERVPRGFEVVAVVTPPEVARLEQLGARVVPPGREFRWRHPDEPATQAAVHQAVQRIAARSSLMVLDEVTVGRVDHFTTKGQGFLSVEAKATAGSAAGAMLLLWDAGPGTPVGSGGATVMSAFVDSGEYMYHRVLTTVQARPSQVLVLSTLGGNATGEVSQWLHPVEPLTERPGYQASFITGYLHPTQLYDRFDELARQHPEVAEVVELPNTSVGYRRKAQATIGSGDAAVVVSSVAWGHEGGNDVTVQLLAPAAGQELGVTVQGSAVRVQLGTGSTAAQVVAAVNDGAGSLVRAHTYRGSAGGGIVQPAGPVALTDFLVAPPSVARDPFAIRALRIGRHRDGSKTGVLIIAQDHAREWVTPMVALEAAERLLANYTHDAETQRIIDNVDIFIIPSNNPDGSHYSHFDFASQRKNMTDHCADNNSDPGRRNSWGVDLNRNYRVGSAHDGYSGGSFDCLSGTYQGPEKLSEPEAKNIIELVETHGNIKFFMTIHSNGGQLFWQPGAYIAQGRVTTPRPELRDETYYWQMADRILSHVKAYQDTVVRPDSVGGSADVLYSSAGNVREDLYHTYGIYAFGWEIGGSVWNPSTRTWVAGSFQPPWSRAYGETMEYANGVMEMFRIAADYGDDVTPPEAMLMTGTATSAGVPVRFSTSEPATVYYTTDGTLPTLESPRYKASGLREGGERIWVTTTTTFRWFSVDPAGNIENGYDPADGTGYREATVSVS